IDRRLLRRELHDKALVGAPMRPITEYNSAEVNPLLPAARKAPRARPPAPMMRPSSSSTTEVARIAIVDFSFHFNSGRTSAAQTTSVHVAARIMVANWPGYLPVASAPSAR